MLVRKKEEINKKNVDLEYGFIPSAEIYVLGALIHYIRNIMGKKIGFDGGQPKRDLNRLERIL